MKILFLSNLYPPHFVGGYELHCATIAQALEKRGHTVHVLTSTHGLQTSPPFSPEEKVHRHLRLHGMFGHPWLPMAKLYTLEKHNNQRVRQAVNALKPDLVFAWNCSGLSKSMLATLEQLQRPVVFTVCDHWIARGEKADVWLKWWNSPAQPLAQRLARGVFKALGAKSLFHSRAPIEPLASYRFRHMYFCSRSLKEFTQKSGYDVSCGRVIYCPIDIDLFRGTPKTREDSFRTLLWVGRLTNDKGPMTALKAFHLLKGKTNCCLHLFGTGERSYVKKLEDFVAEHQLPVTFCGGLPPEQIPAIYPKHDGFLFTSEWEEPFALTPLEAMSSGLPVIGTTTGGSKELFRNQENALTYTAGDAAGLARCIQLLEENPQLREKIALQGYREVRANYNIPVIAAQVEAYLFTALGNA